jgi:hypothetical protein
MAFSAAASPLCTWLIAACVSNSVSGLSGNDAPVSSGPLGRRLRRRIARSKQLAAESWFSSVGMQAASLSGQSLVAFCGSGLSELGTFCSLEGCEEYNKMKPLFGDGFFGEGLEGLGFGTKPVRAGRRLRRAAAGKTRLVQVILLLQYPHQVLNFARSACCRDKVTVCDTQLPLAMRQRVILEHCFGNPWRMTRPNAKVPQPLIYA